MKCLICKSEAVVKEVKCIAKALEGKTSEFVMCGNSECGFIFNHKNFYDYSSGFDSTSKPGEGARAGDGNKPGREFYISKMGVDILNKCGKKTPEIKILIFGPGLSRDHDLIRNEFDLSEVSVTDKNNFQETDFFIDIERRDKKYDIVVACEVLEHFVDIENDFKRIFSKLNDSGLIIASTNINDGVAIEKLIYPFITGHTAYYSGLSLLNVCRNWGGGI